MMGLLGDPVQNVTELGLEHLPVYAIWCLFEDIPPSQLFHHMRECI